MPPPVQLKNSGTKYLLSLELNHHSAVSNATLKPIISPFHEIPTHLVIARTSYLSLFLAPVRQVYYVTRRFQMSFGGARSEITYNVTNCLELTER